MSILFAIEQISGAPAAAQGTAQSHAAERARAGADCLNPAGRIRACERRRCGNGSGLW
jgi:hypothetical protein